MDAINKDDSFNPYIDAIENGMKEVDPNVFDHKKASVALLTLAIRMMTYSGDDAEIIRKKVTYVLDKTLPHEIH